MASCKACWSKGESRWATQHQSRQQLPGPPWLLAGNFAGGSRSFCPHLVPTRARLSVGWVHLRPGRLPVRCRGRGGACCCQSPWRHRPPNAGRGAGRCGPAPQPPAVARHVRGAIFTPWQGAAGGCCVWEAPLGTALLLLFPETVPLGKTILVNLNTGFGKNRQTKLPV